MIRSQENCRIDNHRQTRERWEGDLRNVRSPGKGRDFMPLGCLRAYSRLSSFAATRGVSYLPPPGGPSEGSVHSDRM